MLTAVTAVDGSAAYVAIEHFQGRLAGASGAFTLSHHGVMVGDQQSLLIKIVPDSGEGELTGISGTMAIVIEDGVHRYTLNYQLP